MRMRCGRRRGTSSASQRRIASDDSSPDPVRLGGLGSSGSSENPAPAVVEGPEVVGWRPSRRRSSASFASFEASSTCR